MALGEADSGIYASGIWSGIELGLIPVWLVLLHFRRRWPFRIAMLLSIASFVSVTSVGAMGIALVSLATTRNRRHILVTCVVEFAAAVGFQMWSEPGSTLEDWITNLVFTILFLGFCVATGLAIGARRELVVGLQQRLHDIEREQELRAAQAKVAERTRIAREMHDVLAHRISLVVMHSGALAYRTDASPDEIRESSAIVRDNAQHALAELREVLGVLRDPDAGGTDTPDAPQPTLHDLPLLIERTRETDGPIVSTLPHRWDGLSGLVSRNAFRIVQECVTNRRKHAPHELLRVVLDHADGRLTIDVRNRAVRTTQGAQPLPESGLGLVGLTERAVLSGGELTDGVDRSGDFVVRAWLPWERDDG